jgi:hypothetical protein
MYSDTKTTRSVADAVTKIMMGEKALHPNQQKLDVHEPEKDELTADDFKKLRAGKKTPEVKKEEVGLDEVSLKTATSAYVKRMGDDGPNEKSSQDKATKTMDLIAKKHGVRGVARAAKTVDDKYGLNDPVHNPRKAFVKQTMANVKKEEVEQIQEYESKGGVYRHKGTYGTEKSVEAGYTDYDKENELAKKNLKDKPNRKKYGARQNFVRSTRVNESFSALLGVYKESGLKGLEEALVKEEPTNDQYNAELEDAKAKAEGKKKQPDLTKGYIQAVKNEETEIQVIDADKINGVQIDTIEEKEMTEPEMKKREEIVKSMKKGMTGFKERYGERAKNVMYATATKQAMKD